jgi:hypothetical protein
MSKVKLTTYRGWDISFDLDSDRFYVVSDEYDQQEDRGSIKAAKKWIDDFIKANSEFKPFEIQKMESYDSAPTKSVTVIGRRRDGRFLIKEGDKDPEQLSSYNEGGYIIPMAENNDAIDQIRSKQKEIKAIQTEIEALKKTLIIKRFPEYVKERFGEHK